MMLVGTGFALIMAILGWYVTWRLGFDPAAVTMCVIASAFLVTALIGWIRGHLLVVAGGEIGCAILFPTGFGLVMMIVGFVLFILMIGLRLAEMIEGEA